MSFRHNMNNLFIICIVILKMSYFCFAERDIFSIRKMHAKNDCMQKMKIADDKKKRFFLMRTAKSETEMCFMRCVYEEIKFLRGDEILEEEIVEYIEYRYKKYRSREAPQHQINMIRRCIRGINAISPWSKCTVGGFMGICLMDGISRI